MSASSVAPGGNLPHGRGSIPAVHWLRRYGWPFFRADLAAGLTLGAFLLPSALGYASLAGLPPQAGLYACAASGLVFWLFCSSRQTAISVSSGISLLIGSALGEMAGGDPARFVVLAAGTALLTAAIAALAWLTRAGAVVEFISDTVMLGFEAGVALQLALTQLPRLCGLPAGRGDFLPVLGALSHQFGAIHWPSFLVGLTALGLLLLGKRLLPHQPVSLLVVALAILAAHAFDFQRLGISLLGEVPGGFVRPGWPLLHRHDLQELLPLALACFLLAAIETAAIGRMFSVKGGYRFDGNQEFLALAAANLAAGLSHGLPVSGGTSQSLVNENAGARTPLSGLFASGLLLLISLAFTGLLRHLAQPVLAAVVLMSVTSLVKLSDLRWLWRVQRAEFLLATISLLGVLWAGLLRGVLIGAILSLVLVLRHVARPHVAFLGRIPGTRRYSDLSRHADNELIPGVLAFRVESSLVYFNADHVFDTVLAQLDRWPHPIKLVVCDLSTSATVDMASTRMFLALHSELATRGIALRLVEARSSVRDMLRAEGLEHLAGHIDRFTSVDHAIEVFRDESAAFPHPSSPHGAPTSGTLR